MQKPILKQFGDLTLNDFTEYPVGYPSMVRTMANPGTMKLMRKRFAHGLARCQSIQVRICFWCAHT